MSNSLYWQYIRYTIPTVAAMLVNGLYQLVDGIFIGHYIGSSGLAAINIAWVVTGSVTGIGLMVGVGTGALASIRKGEQNLESARQTLATGMIFAILLSLVLSLLLWTFAQTVLSWQSDDAAVLSLAWDYLQILSPNALFMLGATAMPFLMRNDDSPNKATLLMMLGGGLNIFLDYLFIGIFNWQLAGAATATILSQFMVTVLALHYFFSPSARLRLTWSDFRFRPREIHQIILIGTSSFFMYLYWGVMVGFHNSQFATYGGTVVVAAYAIIGYIVTFYYLTVEGIANGMQPLASYNYGARAYLNILRLLRVAMFLAVALGLMVIWFLNLYPGPVISLFSGGEVLVENYVKQGIVLHLFALFLDGFLVVVAAFYQSINSGRKAMIITIGNIIIQPPFLWVLPKWFDLTGVWLAFPISNMTISVWVIWVLWKDVRRLARHAEQTPASLRG